MVCVGSGGAVAVSGADGEVGASGTGTSAVDGVIGAGSGVAVLGVGSTAYKGPSGYAVVIGSFIPASLKSGFTSFHVTFFESKVGYPES